MLVLLQSIILDEMEENTPLFTNDAVVFGLLMAILAVIFATSASERPLWRKFYSIVPTVLLCYFIPALANSFGLISGESSGLYKVASRYLLPASLVLFTISIDIKGILKLGPKALTMFLAGTVGIMLGGPLALMTVGFLFPELLGGSGPEEVWRGLSTIAGSWIGGGANQTAMLEVFGPSPELFSQMIAVDVLVANLWMAFLLYWAAKPEKIDKLFKADSTKIYELRDKIEEFRKGIMRIPTLSDTMIILGVGFGVTGLAHLIADFVAPYIGENYPSLKQYSLDSAFFWIVVIATTAGLLLSFTKARKLEGAGASRMGSVLLYVLVATIGMQMDLGAVLDNPLLFVVGIVWMIFHIIIMLIVAFIIKAPFFYVAVGSQANVGGAASAPIVAAAFDASLAPVGVLLAVLGYAAGTYGAYLCGLMMQVISGG
ncbi:putative membrane protein [Algoriphagus yeomjeoni]|uniref:Putative membrane protein n=2 Tax=Algoriphagus yeomjeoni TaxID=291403 RepID=A0A327NZY8_9BACT|nr:putative membrane protein [Algoriphagus yeomjeoni]